MENLEYLQVSPTRNNCVPKGHNFHNTLEALEEQLTHHGKSVLKILPQLSISLLKRLECGAGKLDDATNPYTEFGLLENPRMKIHRLLSVHFRKRPPLRRMEEKTRERQVYCLSLSWLKKTKESSDCDLPLGLNVVVNPNLSVRLRVQNGQVIARSLYDLSHVARNFTHAKGHQLYKCLKMYSFNIHFDAIRKYAHCINIDEVEKHKEPVLQVLLMNGNGSILEDSRGSRALDILSLNASSSCLMNIDCPLMVFEYGWNLVFISFTHPYAQYLKQSRLAAKRPLDAIFFQNIRALERGSEIRHDKHSSHLKKSIQNHMHLRACLWILWRLTGDEDLQGLRDRVTKRFLKKGTTDDYISQLTQDAEACAMNAKISDFRGLKLSETTLLALRRLTRAPVKSPVRTEDLEDKIVLAAKAQIEEWPRLKENNALKSIITEDEWVKPVKIYFSRINVHSLSSHPYVRDGYIQRFRLASVAEHPGSHEGFTGALNAIFVRWCLDHNKDPTPYFELPKGLDEESLVVLKDQTDEYFRILNEATRKICEDQIEHCSSCTGCADSSHADMFYEGILPDREGGSKLRCFPIPAAAFLFQCSGVASLLTALLSLGRTVGEMFRGVERLTGRRLAAGFRELCKTVTGGICAWGLDASRSTDFLASTLSIKLLMAAYDAVAHLTKDPEWDRKLLRASMSGCNYWRPLKEDGKLAKRPIWKTIPLPLYERLEETVDFSEDKVPIRKGLAITFVHQKFKPKGLRIENHIEKIRDACSAGLVIIEAPTGFGKTSGLPNILSAFNLGPKGSAKKPLGGLPHGSRVLVGCSGTGALRSVCNQNPEYGAHSRDFKKNEDAEVVLTTMYFFNKEMAKSSSRFSIFLLDEVHKEQISQLVSLALMRQNPQRNRLCIITGATIDEDFLGSFLGCRHLKLEADAIPLKDRYETVSCHSERDMESHASSFIAESGVCSAIIFGRSIPLGEARADRMRKQIEKLRPEAKIRVLPFHGKASESFNSICLSPFLEEKEDIRLIVSSDKGQEGVTFPKLIAVLSDEVEWEDAFHPERRISSRSLVRADDKSSTQRAGRLGRVEPDGSFRKGKFFRYNSAVTSVRPQERHYIADLEDLLDQLRQTKVNLEDLPIVLNDAQLEYLRLHNNDRQIDKSVPQTSLRIREILMSGEVGDYILGAMLQTDFPSRGELATTDMIEELVDRWRTGEFARSDLDSHERKESGANAPPILLETDRELAYVFLYWLSRSEKIPESQEDIQCMSSIDQIERAAGLVRQPTRAGAKLALDNFGGEEKSGVYYIKNVTDSKGSLTHRLAIQPREVPGLELPERASRNQIESCRMTQEQIEYKTIRIDGSARKGIHPTSGKPEVTSWKQWLEIQEENQALLVSWWKGRKLGQATDACPMSSTISVVVLGLTNLSIRISPYFYRDKLLDSSSAAAVTSGYGDDQGGIGTVGSLFLILFGMDYVRQIANEKSVVQDLRLTDGRLLRSALVQTEIVYRAVKKRDGEVGLALDEVLKVRTLLASLSEGLSGYGVRVDRENSWIYRKDMLDLLEATAPSYKNRFLEIFDDLYREDIEEYQKRVPNLHALGIYKAGTGTEDPESLIAECVPKSRTISRQFVSSFLEGKANFDDTKISSDDFDTLETALEHYILHRLPPERKKPECKRLEDVPKLEKRSEDRLYIGSVLDAFENLKL